MEIQDIIKIQKKHEKSLMRKTNVVSVGCGYKFKDGKQTEEIGIIVGVSEKLPSIQLFALDIIPDNLDGVTVDVHQVGQIKSFEIDPTNRHRPAMPGISIGHKNITSGTFGCVVEKSGTKLLLSNNHVFADTNNASIGDAIYQPGAYDSGTASDTIGTLFDFVPIEFNGSGGGEDPGPTCPLAKSTAATANAMARVFGRQHRVVAFNADPMAVINKVDAALCIPDNDSDIIDEIVQIGKPQGISEASLGTQVQKYGRTTRHTTGTIIQINVSVQVSYGSGRVATFVGQFITGAMSAGGDSGSAGLTMDNKLFGLLYAGSDETTIFSPIQDVFKALSVNLPGKST